MFTIDAKQLKAAVKVVSKACAPAKEQRVLSGIHVHGLGQSIDLVAADGFRLTRVNLDIDGEYTEQCTLELKPLLAAVSGLRGTAFVQIDADGAQFNSSEGRSDAVAIVPIIAGRFPDYIQIIPDLTGVPGHTLDADALMHACAPIHRRKKDDSHCAHLWVGENGIEALTATGTAFETYTRWFRDPTQGEFELEKLTTMNPNFLATVGALHKGQTLNVSAASPNTAVTVTCGNALHLLMPTVLGNYNAKDPYEPAPATVDEPAPATEPTRAQYVAVAALACSRCGGHEIDRTGPASGTCAECDGAAEPDPFARYGPSYSDFLRGEIDRARIARARDILDSVPPTGPNDVPGAALDSALQQVRALHDATTLTCPRCGTPAEPDDKFCGECGARLSPPEPEPDDTRPHIVRWKKIGAAANAEIERQRAELHACETWPGYVPIGEKYHGQNPTRILTACPHATDVRGFHDWLKAGRCVQKGQHGIAIYAPTRPAHEDADGTIDDAPRRMRVKPAYVFDISQTAELDQPTASAAD